jgi:transposase-like protein
MSGKVRYSQEFKDRVVELDRNRTVNQERLAREIGVPAKTIRRWKAREAEEAKRPRIGTRVDETEREELERLRRRMKEVDQIMQLHKDWHFLVQTVPEKKS